MRPAPTLAPDQPIPGLTRSAVEAAGKPVILARIPQAGTAATLVYRSYNAGYATYLSGDGITVTLRGGMLAATRGLGGDLLSADTDAALAAIQRRQAARYDRTLHWIGGERQVRDWPLSCEMQVAGAERIEILGQAHETTHMVEDCTAPDGSRIQNGYWIDRALVIWQSRQFLHPDLGYITVQQLVY